MIRSWLKARKTIRACERGDRAETEKMLVALRAAAARLEPELDNMSRSVDEDPRCDRVITGSYEGAMRALAKEGFDVADDALQELAEEFGDRVWALAAS